MASRNELNESDKASLDRGSACTPCRKKKMKCDRKNPICSQCQRSYAPNDCEYPAKVLTKTGRLLNRIKELEDQISMLEVSDASNSNQQSGPPSPRGLHPFGPNNSEFISPSAFLSESMRALPRISSLDWIGDEPPSELKSFLVRSFLRHHQILAFPLHIPRFLRALELPPTDPEALHPCLLYAVMLLGTIYELPTHGMYEGILLARVRNGNADALAMADRLFHFLISGSLLMRWYSMRGRALEARQQAVSIAQFAVACNFNNITSSLVSEFPQSIAGPPADAIEVGERVRLFWDVYLNEKTSALHCGEQSHLPDINVATMWPQDLDKFEDGTALMSEYGSASTILYPTDLSFSVANDCTLALRVKCTILVDRASRLSSLFLSHIHPSNPHHDLIRDKDAFWAEVTIIHTAILTLMSTLPSIFDSREMEDAELYLEATDRAHIDANGMLINPMIVCAHTCAHAAAMELYNMASSYDQDAYGNMIEEAGKISLLAKAADGLDPRRFTVANALSWVAACDVLIREAQRPNGERADVHITDVNGTTREKIGWLLNGLRTVAREYPGSYKASMERLEGLTLTLD